MAGLTVAELEAVVSVNDAEFDKGLDRSMGHFAGWGGKLKAAAATVGVASGALFATALVKGFKRLSAIDQAKAKLEGLGHSSSEVEKIMTNALAAVKGTAYGLDEAATVSATAVAAGIKPGKQLEKTLRLVADAATIGGTSMSEMGAIFNKVAASNKLQGDVIQQLNQQGIPILQMLAKTMHKSVGEVLDLSKKGKVSFRDFSKAMQEGLGGAALKSGDTFTGAWKNMMASLSRIGAGLLGGIFPHLAPAIQNMTKAMGPAEDLAGKIGDKIGRVLGPALENAVPWVQHLTDHLGSINWSGIGSGVGKLGPGFAAIGDALGRIDWSKVGDAFGSGASDSLKVTAVVVGFLADHLDLLAKGLPFLLAGFAALKVAQAAERAMALVSIPTKIAQTAANIALRKALVQNTAALRAQSGTEAVANTTTKRGTVAKIASAAASKVAAGAAKAWALAQRVLNAALRANPIGIVITVVAALVTGLVIAYKKSETFRKIVNGAFKGIQTAAKFMWNNVLRPVFKFILNTWLTVAGGIVHGAAKAFGWVPGIGPKLRSAAGKFDEFKNQVNRALSRIPNNKTTHFHVTGVIPGINAVDQLRRSMARLHSKNITVRVNEIHGRSFGSHGKAMVPAMATGGRVAGPTLALIGEGREPETVLPDSLLRGLLERTHNAGVQAGRGSRGRERDRGALMRDVIFQGAQGASPRELMDELGHFLRVAEFGGTYAGAGAA